MLAHVLWALQLIKGSDDAKCLLLAIKVVRALIQKVIVLGDSTEEQVRLLAKRLEERITADMLGSTHDHDGEGIA